MPQPSGTAQGGSNTPYALGYTSNENDRLIRQAARIAPITERLFRDAGIGEGKRVLDLGSGMGDVAMLVARLVGPSGQVLGVERDSSSVARARARVEAAGLRNVTFTHGDVSELASDMPFDAAVGRFILMFLPDPRTVLESVVRLVRPGGAVAFQEPTWIPFLAFSKRLPLWSRMLQTIHETFLRAGVNPEMGPELYRLFPEVGLPAPNMHVEMALGSDAEFSGLICDLLSSVRALAEHHQVSLKDLGDLETLSQRVQAEIAQANTMVSFVPMVGVWAKKPAAHENRD